MYWIERCADGSYIHGGIEYPFRQTISEELEAYEIERSGTPGRKSSSRSTSKPFTDGSDGTYRSLNIRNQASPA